jgi:hypothetical protein
VLQSYVGEYAFTPTVSVTVTLEGTQLFVQPTGQLQPLFRHRSTAVRGTNFFG